MICKERSAKKTLDMLRSSFKSILNHNVDEISPFMIETWRIERKSSGTKPGTINKRLSSLRAAFRWGADNGVIKENPLERLKRLSERSDSKVRYLADDERARLIASLDARESRIREGVKNHNEWLSERNLPEKPLITGKYADYLKPMILLSLNTGIRKDNLFSLLWGDIDFQNRVMTLRAEETKSSKMLRLPLNSDAFGVLTAWRDQSGDTAPSGLVFPSPKTGGRLDNCDSSWQKLLKEAEIVNFRWHDMRHDFASRLAMSGVALITIKELLGHSDIKTTLIYAHLAPNIKRDAVELLSQTPESKIIGRISA
jgi:integrase